MITGKSQRLKEQGITLIALVVTIIILLILAVVTLNLALGGDGIFARAKNTVDRYQAAQANEQEQMAKLEEMLNSYGDGIGSSEVAEGLKEYQGKFVDIGVNIVGTDSTADDWELFYATEDKIFLIAADYVPVTQLSKWGVIEALKGNGFQQSSSGYKYGVNWSKPENFSENLPDLKEVMHTRYDLKKQSIVHFSEILLCTFPK